MSLAQDSTLSKQAALDLLTGGTMEVEGLLPGSSNYTFLATVSDGNLTVLAVYKPSQGETPLWDFPHGTLSRREMAAFVLSDALGWDLVPPTVLRVGPYGKGAVQLFVDADFQEHYFTLQDEPQYQLAFQRIATFDVIANNADRKSGHCLVDQQQRIWAIDHGLCFHVQPKLRTVIWDYAGQALPSSVQEALVALCSRLEDGDQLASALKGLLSPPEVRVLQRRISNLAGLGRFPEPDPHRRSYPWPLV